MFTFTARIETGKHSLIGSGTTLFKCLWSFALIGVAVGFAFSAKLAVASDWYPENLYQDTSFAVPYNGSVELRVKNTSGVAQSISYFETLYWNSSARSKYYSVQRYNSSGVSVQTCYSNTASLPASTVYSLTASFSPCSIANGEYAVFSIGNAYSGDSMYLFGANGTTTDMSVYSAGSLLYGKTPLISFRSQNALSNSYIIVPPVASTTASYSVQVPYSYYLSGSDSAYPYVLETLTSLDFSYDSSITRHYPVGSTGNLYQATTSLTAVRSGTHLLVINFWNGKSGFDSKLKAGSSIQLQVASSTVIDEFGFARAGIEQACSSTTSYIDSLLCRTFNWLFVPSERSIQKITDFDMALQTRAPFAYVYDMKVAKDEFFSSTSYQNLSIGVTTTIGRIDFLNKSLIQSVPYTSTLRMILGWVLWFMLANYIYYRVLNIYSQKQS